MAGTPGPAKLPYSSLSPAGKSQRRNPDKHRAYNRKRNRSQLQINYRSDLNKKRREKKLGKAGKTGPVLGHTKSGKIQLTSRKKNSDVSKSRYHK